MLKALLKKQLRENLAFLYRKGKNGKPLSKGFAIGMGILLLFCYASLFFAFFGISAMFGDALIPAGGGWLYFVMLGMMALALSVMGSVMVTYSGLFRARDNDLLLSLPIPPRLILLSRMLNVYGMALLFMLLPLLPAIVFYVIKSGCGIGGAIPAVIAMLLLALLSLVISCVLGYIVALIAKRIRNKAILTTILSVLFIVVYYYCCLQSQKLLNQLLAAADRIGEVVRGNIWPLYQFGMASAGDWKALGLLALAAAAVFALCLYIISRTFIGLATAPGTVARKRGPVRFEGRIRTVSGTLLYKEYRRLMSTSVYMMNCALGALLTLVIAAVLIIKRESMMNLLGPVLSSGMLPEGIVVLFIAAVTGFVASMNILSAPAVALEGRGIRSVQSLPVSGWQVLRAKESLHMIISLPPTLVLLAVLCIMLSVPVTESLLVAVFLFFFILYVDDLGLVMGIRHPHLDWTNETAAVKQNMNVLMVMLASTGVIVMLGVAYWLLNGMIAPAVFLAAAVSLLAVITVLLRMWLIRRGGTIFETLS